MRHKNVLAVLAIFLLIFSNGCIYLVIGSVGAVGGYAISSDSVQGMVQRDFDEVWDAAVSVTNIMGKIVKESAEAGRLEAIINNARVKVSVAQFTPKQVRLTVKARKSFFPSIATAQDVYVKIISQLNGD